MRWTLGADEEVLSLFKSDPGNVDLPRTMLLPDSAANAGMEVWCRQTSHEGGV